MTKTILITGATDGIGFELAKLLSNEGHRLLLHGRSKAKMDATVAALDGTVTAYLADFSDLNDVAAMAQKIAEDHSVIDSIVNNAGVLKLPKPTLSNGQDARFVVNMFAPYLLTNKLLPLVPKDGRIINLSSAAQASVDIAAMKGGIPLSDMEAYSQSKLAITMWSKALAESLPEGPSVIAVNPGSLLASKMVKEGFGVAGNDLSIGAQILRDAALSAQFNNASGKYFDNDAGQFGPPHPDAMDPVKVARIAASLEEIVG